MEELCETKISWATDCRKCFAYEHYLYIYKVVAFVCVCVCVCVCVQLSYSPHHWADHDQTWHDDGPPPRDGAHHFSRSRSKVKVIAYVYILSYSPHHWTDHDQTWHDDGSPPRDGAHHFPR